jgi:hypothetical protein
MNLYFPPEQRLHRDLIPVFAENLLDQYPHEYVGDIGAFFARASMGRYGEQDRDGTVVKRGQTFGKLTMMTLAEWFRQYLEERAEEEERARLRNQRIGQLSIKVVLQWGAIEDAREEHWVAVAAARIGQAAQPVQR